MTTKYFNVKVGLTTGNITLDASTGNITGSNANLGNLAIANYFSGSGNLLANIQAANVSGQIANANVSFYSNVSVATSGTYYPEFINASTAGNYAPYTNSAFTFNAATGKFDATLLGGTLTTAAQPNVTSVGTLTGLTVSDGTANTVSIYGNGTLTSTGNITAPYIIANVVGNISGTLAVPGNNTAVIFNDVGAAGASDALKFDKVANTLTLTGNLSTYNANLGNLAKANYFSGTFDSLSNAQPNITSVGTLKNTTLGSSNSFTGGNLVSATYLGGTLTTAAQPNITSVGTLSSLDVSGAITSGDVTISGNLTVTGTTEYVNSTNTFITDPIVEQGGAANGGALSSNDNKDRGTLLHYYSSGVVDAFMGWKNSAGEFILASNATVSSNQVTVNTYGNLHVGNANLGNLATANYFTGTLTTAAQPNITSVGTLSDLTVTGNVAAGNITGGNLVSANYFSGNLSGNGSAISALNASNIASGTISSGVLGNSSLYVGTTSIALNRSSASLSLTGITSIDGYAATVSTNAQPNITSVGSLTGLTVSNATGVVNFTTTANVTLGAIGNLHISGGSSGYILQTNGSGGLSFVAPPSTSSVTNGTSNVSIPTTDGNINFNSAGNTTMVVTGTGANITGYANITGNVTAGNVAGGNLVSANYISGNGSLMTALNASNLASGTISSGILGNSTVYVGTTGIALNRASGSQSLTGITSIDGYAATVSSAAQPNITSVGTLTSLAVSGTTTTTNVSTNGILSNRANVTVTSGTVIDEFAPATYRSAKYVISASGTNGYQTAEVLLVQDGTNSYITIYGSLCSNSTADIVDFSSNINGVSGNVALYATASGASTKVNLMAVYLKT